MTLAITHAFVSAVADDPIAVAAGEVVPSNWNASHSLTGTKNTIAGFDNSGNFNTVTPDGTTVKLIAGTLSAVGGGSSTLAYSTFTSTNSTVGTEQVIETPSGTFTLTLTSPTVSAGQAWRTFFKNSGTGTVTLSATIDGGASFTLGAGSGATLIFNGTSWLVE